MDTRFLESFVTAVDCGSIAEAARRLNLTAAGLARQIRVLERELGVVLLVRSGRTVRPTGAAGSILDRAKRFLNDARDLKSTSTSGEVSGELRLGSMQTTLASLVPEILRRMRQAHPRVRIDIIRDGSTQLYQRVVTGELDAALTSEPPFAIPKTHNWRVLREEPYVLLASKDLPRGRPLAILAREPFIRLHRRVYAGRVIDGYLRKMKIRPNEVFELDGIEAIAVMVDRGLGVAILPDWAPPWPEGLSLRKLQLPEGPRRRVGLIWSGTSPRVGLIEAFLRQAERALTPARVR
jgi:DNA-binding transcriptional LysR family regulator